MAFSALLPPSVLPRVTGMTRPSADGFLHPPRDVVNHL